MEIMKKKEEFNKMLSINSNNNHLDHLGGGGLSNIGGVLHGSTVPHLSNNNPGGSPHSSQQAPPPLSLIIKQSNMIPKKAPKAAGGNSRLSAS
jgi:hypothetical protein